MNILNICIRRFSIYNRCINFNLNYNRHLCLLVAPLYLVTWNSGFHAESFITDRSSLISVSTKPHDSDRDTQFLLQDIWVQVIKFITFPKLHILMQTILNDNSALLTLLKKFYGSPSLIQLKIKTSPCISITSQLYKYHYLSQNIFSVGNMEKFNLVIKIW